MSFDWTLSYSFKLILIVILTGLLSSLIFLIYYFFKKYKIYKKSYLKMDALLLMHEANPNPIIKTDFKGKIIYSNSPAQILINEWGIDVGDYLPRDKVAIIDDVIESQVEEEIDQKCGNSIYSIKFQPTVDGVILFSYDIANRIKVEKELMQMTVFDQITNLPNRFLFVDKVNQCIDESKTLKSTFFLIVILLEDIKEIFDAFGQEIGARVLQAVSQRFQEHISEDAILAKVDDTQFGLIEKKIKSQNELETFIQKFYKSCNTPYELNGKLIVCEIKIGVSQYPENATNANKLIQNAIIAANRAKIIQNPFELYIAEMNATLEARRTIVGEMHHALENNQFKLFYQPQVIAHSGKIVGAEALIRWIHPDKGMISPGLFIPAAEESGIIIPLSEWVLKEACNQIAKWSKEGINIKVGVNVSAKQFNQSDLIGKVKYVIEETCISPNQLELELTEGLVIHDIEKTIQIMTELRKLGVELALDDFGTGYSSLSYLKRFPIQKLKIDRAFVMDIDSESDEVEITSGIIQLGHALKLKVITEGVENKAQLEYLIKHKCDLIQGFYFGKPMPPEEFETLYFNQE